jgi:hypothetical protein
MNLQQSSTEEESTPKSEQEAKNRAQCRRDFL